MVAAQIAELGSFETFLLALVLAGFLQIGLGLIRTGGLVAFVPSTVIKGLLVSIGIVLILKQLPHFFGHDTDPEGEMSFSQPDHENTFSELFLTFFDIHPGATLIGVSALALLILWELVPALKRSKFPAPLLVVMLGVVLGWAMERMGSFWAIGPNHLVQVPVSGSPSEFFSFLTFPNYGEWTNFKIYNSAIMIALLASLETLLNLEAVDKIDPLKRTSPPDRELVAQGVGNVLSGMIGGLPVASVIVRSSVNIHAGGKSRLATIFHGALLLLCVLLLPRLLNQIPLSALAAVLLITGWKLTLPSLFIQTWKEGWNQFLPFIGTIIAILFTDLLIGVLIGLALAIGFILQSNLRRPLRRVIEKHASGDVMRIELANQVSFLNRGSLMNVLNEVPRGGHVLIDARSTDYIDADVLDLIREFETETAPARSIQVSLMGFKDRYKYLVDKIQYVDFVTRDLQEKMTPDDVVRLFKEGNERFRTGQQISRNLMRQMDGTALSQHPIAVVLSCIDSRSPAEIIFDLGLGDILSVRIAGNIAKDKILGSMEYGCAVAGAKLILVLGHTRCGAVTAAVNLYHEEKRAVEAYGCSHIDVLVSEIQKAIPHRLPGEMVNGKHVLPEKAVDEIAKGNVLRTMQVIYDQSSTLRQLVDKKAIKIVGSMYDVRTGYVEFLSEIS